MTSRLSTVTLLLLAIVGPLASKAQGEAMSLEQAVAFAQNNSNDIRDAELAVLDAEALVKENLSIGLPQISGGASYQYYFKVPLMPLPEAFRTPGGPEALSFVLRNNFTGSVNLESMLFDGTYFVGLRAARAARNYAQLELNSRKRQVAVQVREAYLPLLLIDANLSQLEKNIAAIEKLRTETKAIFDAGFAEQLDVDRLDLSLANLQTELESLQRQRGIALRSLKFALNYPEGSELAISDDMEKLLAEATQDGLLAAKVDYLRRPEIVQLNEALGLNALNVERYRSGYLPSLRAFGGYQYQYQGDDFKSGFWAPTGFVGVRLNVPIYDGGYKKALIERARIDVEQIKLQQNTMQRLVDLEVQNARDAYQTAQRRLENQEKNLALAERIYQTTNTKYREGVGSSLEIIQAEQALYTAQGNRLQSLYELLNAKIQLEQALGWR